MGKFAAEAMRFQVDLHELFNRAIRQALMAGLTAAVNKTKQDSSNAAAHWTIKVRGQQRSGGRAWSRLRDLRETRTGGKKSPGVGRRRDAGKNRQAVLTLVRDRELRDVVNKFVSGRSPSTIFSFFNPIEEGSDYWDFIETSDLPGLTLSEAGQLAVERVQDILAKRIAAGQTRKRRL
jgi:hypothetical protein